MDPSADLIVADQNGTNHLAVVGVTLDPTLVSVLPRYHVVEVNGGTSDDASVSDARVTIDPISSGLSLLKYNVHAFFRYIL